MATVDRIYDQGGAVYNIRRADQSDSTDTGHAVGDGIADDGAVFYGLAAGRHYVVPAGTYRFAQSGAIPDDVTLEFEHGAVLRPDSGVQVSVLGPIIAGASKWIDHSNGGRVLFEYQDTQTPPRLHRDGAIREFLPQWWGVTGDGQTSDSDALDAMLVSIPNYCAVRFASQMVMSLTRTWTISNRDGVVFFCEADPRNVGSNGFAAAFKYGGSAPTTALVFLDRCRYCTVRGFSFDAAGLADACIDLDGYGGGIGTACTIERNFFGGVSRLVSGVPQYNASFVGVRISETVTSNQEYHTVSRNAVYGGGRNARSLAVSSTGTPTVVTGPFVADDVGTRIRIARASSTGQALDTTVIGVNTSTTPPQATLAAATSGTFTTRFALVGSPVGTGVKIGTTANAKKILLEDNQFLGCQFGIRAQGGSFHALHNSFTENEVNISITNLSEPSYDDGSNTERSRQHLDIAAGAPYIVRSGRFDISNTPPDSAFLNLPTNNPILMMGCATENGFSDPSCRFVELPHGNKLVSMSNIFTPAMTMAQFGVTESTRWVSLFDQGITDKPGDTWLGGRVFSSYTDRDGTIVGRTYSAGSGDDPYHTAAVRGEAMAGPQGTAYDAWLVGLQAVVGRQGTVNNANFRGVEVVLPYTSTTQAKLVEGIRILSPDMTGVSAAQRATGVVIEAMRPSGTGINTSRGIDQRGAEDINVLAGPTIQGTPAAALSDSLLQPGQFAFFRNETSGELRVRVKYADDSVHEGVITLT